MAITNAFREAVDSGDIRGVRIMMEDSLLVDPTFAEFAEMERLARSMDGLYDTHDGRELDMNQEKWNDDYMNKLMVQVVGNFSHERIAHLKEVVRYLHPAPAKPANKSESFRATSGQQTKHNASDSTYRKQHYEDMRNGRIVRIVGGAAIGAVVGGAIAAVAGAASGGIIGAAVGGAAIVGIFATATSNKG